jgi:hypothetical protein
MTAHRYDTKRKLVTNSRPTRRPPYARRAAIHEAGHAVVDTVLFGGTTEARLSKQGRQTVGAVAPLFHPSASCRDQSVFVYAGMIAEARFRRCGVVAIMVTSGMNDMHDVNDLCQYVASRHSNRIADLQAFTLDWHQQAERDARRLVSRHWVWINRVADHLQVHGHMTGEQVKLVRP